MTANCATTTAKTPISTAGVPRTPAQVSDVTLQPRQQLTRPSAAGRHYHQAAGGRVVGVGGRHQRDALAVGAPRALAQLSRRVDGGEHLPVEVDHSTRCLDLARADGVHYWDVNDKRYLDALSGIYVVSVGHNNRRVIDAIRRQFNIGWWGVSLRLYGREDVNRVFEEIEKSAMRPQASKLEVALEDLGSSKATEMLEDLETWMPDTPDATKWVQEEPLDKKPMAMPEMPLPDPPPPEWPHRAVDTADGPTGYVYGRVRRLDADTAGRFGT